MKKTIALVIAVYLALSCFISIIYNVYDDYAWDIACHRNGLLIIGFDDDTMWLLSPFCNYPDVFLFGIAREENAFATYWRFFSDGLDCFGEW